MKLGQKKRKRKVKKKSKKLYFVFILIIFLGLNFVLQLILKPAEVISLIVPDSSKTPRQTWQSYKNDFIDNETALISAELLAAFAQVESSGDSYTSPEWKFNWTSNLTRIYSPASTSVGLMQMTDGYYNQAKQYCIKNGQLEKEGKWYEFNKCWFNILYSRFWPSHSIEMTAAFLHKEINSLLNVKKEGIKKEKIVQLAALIHLCGKSVAQKFVQDHFILKQTVCGNHSVKQYVGKIISYTRKFNRFKNQ